MLSQSTIDTQLKGYQALLSELKVSLTEEQKCQVVLMSANNEYKLLTSGGMMDSQMTMQAGDEQAILKRIDMAEKELAKAQKKVQAVNKSIATAEKALTAGLTDKLFSNIIAIQTEQKIAGWSNKSGQVLIETLGQIQDAKSTAQLQLMSESFVKMLEFLSLNTDRLDIDSVIAQAELAALAFSKGPVPAEEKEKIIANMKEARANYDQRAEALTTKISAELDQHQQSIKTLQRQLNDEKNNLAKTTQKITELSAQLKTPGLSDQQTKTISANLASENQKLKDSQDKIIDHTKKLGEKNHAVAMLKEGAAKIDKLTEKVHGMTDMPLFQAKSDTLQALTGPSDQPEMTAKEIAKSLKELNEKMIDLSAEATGRTVADVKKEGLTNVKKHTINECIENCIKLTFIRYTQLMVTENLKNEAGRELLIKSVINSVLMGLSIYTLGNPAADLAKDVQSVLSGGKKLRDYRQLDKPVMEALSDYIKNNPLKVKAGGPALVAVATVLFIVFPPTTAIGICGALLSTATTAGDLKELVSYLVSEVKSTREISQSLDKQGELIDALLTEAKAAQAKMTGGLGEGLSAEQEIGLLLGKMISDDARPAPTTAAAAAPKQGTGTLSIFSGLKAKVEKTPVPVALQPVKLATVAATAPSPPKPTNDASFEQETVSVRKISR